MQESPMCCGLVDAAARRWRSFSPSEEGAAQPVSGVRACGLFVK